LAHDIAVVDHGKVIATGTPDELKAHTGGQVLEVSPEDKAQLGEVAGVLMSLTGQAADTDLSAGRGTGAGTGAAAAPRVRGPRRSRRSSAGWTRPGSSSPSSRSGSPASTRCSWR